MTEYRITQAQLDELLDLSPEWPDDCARIDELAAEIRSQPLIHTATSADENSPATGSLVQNQ